MSRELEAGTLYEYREVEIPGGSNDPYPIDARGKWITILGFLDGVNDPQVNETVSELATDICEIKFGDGGDNWSPIFAGISVQFSDSIITKRIYMRLFRHTTITRVRFVLSDRPIVDARHNPSQLPIRVVPTNHGTSLTVGPVAIGNGEPAGNYIIGPATFAPTEAKDITHLVISNVGVNTFYLRDDPLVSASPAGHPVLPNQTVTWVSSSALIVDQSALPAPTQWVATAFYKRVY